MAAPSHSPTPDRGRGGVDVVFTDGACSGNPGPGGWAWVRVDGGWASGYDEDTTNQRMELTAVLRACEHFPGPLHVVSDSTYVVNCWRDRWWQGWQRRGWKNSKKEPVANRDLWEQLVPHFAQRRDLTLEWVKGHSGEHHNEVADRLAVAALERRSGSTGDGVPGPADMAEPDEPGAGRRRPAPTTAPTGESPSLTAAGVPADGSRSAARRAADGRVPEGHLLWVGGVGHGSLPGHGTAEGRRVADQLARVLRGFAEMHPDLVVVSGLRRGAEELGARTALDLGVPVAVVLPYPDPTAGWPNTEAAAFAELRDAAREVVTLEKKIPADAAGRRASLGRRDGWLRSSVDAAVVLVDPADDDTALDADRWEHALAEDLWRLEVAR